MKKRYHIQQILSMDEIETNNTKDKINKLAEIYSIWWDSYRFGSHTNIIPFILFKISGTNYLFSSLFTNSTRLVSDDLIIVFWKKEFILKQRAVLQMKS